MKKTLLAIISILILLTGCTHKLVWTDVEGIYRETEKEINNIKKNITTVTKDNYEDYLEELGNEIDNIEFSQEETNQKKLEKIYKAAEYIQMYASLFEGNPAQELLSLALNTKDLVKSIYSGDKDQFNTLKTSIVDEINAITTWSDEQWSSVEKKAKLLWEDVESEFEKISEEAKESLIAFDKLAEYNLEDLKHTIIDNYQLIEDGVTEQTNEIAQDMYFAAIQLKEYTRKIYSDDADKVYEFAKHAISYIEEAYGKVLQEEEKLTQSFKVDVEDATKWTQSTWNEITKQLKLYSMQ